MKSSTAHNSPNGRRRSIQRPCQACLKLETLEDRCLLATLPPAGTGPLPAVTVGLTAQQVAGADVVVDWNATMLRAIWIDGTPPTQASRVEAMVGVAVFDAVNAIEPAYEAYPVPGLSGAPKPGASAQAAAVAAANAVLSGLYPKQQALFAGEYKATLAQVPDGAAKANGIAWGQKVGNAVLAWRSADGWSATTNYQPAPAGGPAGVYELTPAAGLEAKADYLPALAPQWGQVTPWAMTSGDQFLPPPPPALNSPEYLSALAEVKSLGSAASTTRTADEDQYAHFWSDVPGFSVTPPGHWDEVAEHLSLQSGLSLAGNAHLFALLNIGLADAAISCWDTKYDYNFWRPITAIRAAGGADANWSPLWNTPNFPGYTSGHSTFSGAASVILTSLFGGNTSFTVGSDDMPGYSRTFTSLAQAAYEAGESRVVGGIHFEFDNRAGLASGGALGDWVIHAVLQPLGSANQGRHAGNPPPPGGDGAADGLLLGLTNLLLPDTRFGPASGTVQAPATAKTDHVVETLFLQDLSRTLHDVLLVGSRLRSPGLLKSQLYTLQADAAAFAFAEGLREAPR